MHNVQDVQVRLRLRKPSGQQAIQKLGTANQETLEVLQKELEECLKQHLEAGTAYFVQMPWRRSCEDAGSQKEYMKSEADKCLDQAQKRVEMLIEAGDAKCFHCG